MKKWIKAVAIAFICLASFVPTGASAATIYSSQRHIPATDLNYDPAMVSYDFRAALRMDTLFAQGITTIKGDKTIPQSYAGAMADIYSSSGALLNASGWKFNNWGRTTSFNQTVGYTGTGIMYCKATVSVLAHTQEKIYTTKTGNGTVTRSMSLPEEKVNQNGEVYGSGLSDEQVDLILTIGDNGIEGYVYAEDLYGPLAQNKEEYIEKMNQPMVKTIPVYEEDGITIIDQFTIGTQK